MSKIDIIIFIAFLMGVVTLDVTTADVNRMDDIADDQVHLYDHNEYASEYNRVCVYDRIPEEYRMYLRICCKYRKYIHEATLSSLHYIPVLN